MSMCTKQGIQKERERGGSILGMTQKINLEFQWVDSKLQDLVQEPIHKKSKHTLRKFRIQRFAHSMVFY